MCKGSLGLFPGSDLPSPPELPESRRKVWEEQASVPKAGTFAWTFSYIHHESTFLLSASKGTGQLNTDHTAAGLVSVKLED